MQTRAVESPLRKHAPLLERVRIPQAACSILLFLLVNLDSTLLPGSVDASPWVLVDYTFCSLMTLDGIEDKASGAAFDAERDLLWVITNEPTRLFGYDRTGTLQQQVDVLGIRDPEGVTWTAGSELAIMEEGATGALALVDVPPDTTEVLVQIRRPVGTGVRDNAGPEGVAFDPRDEGFFFVNEREPQRVMKLFSNGTMNDIFDPGELQLADLSGLYFSQMPQPSLFILSQTDRKLVHVDLEGNLLGSRLVHGNRPEGVAFTPDGAVMYIVSEPNQLALFSAEMDCQAAAQAQPAPAISAG